MLPAICGRNHNGTGDGAGSPICRRTVSGPDPCIIAYSACFPDRNALTGGAGGRLMGGLDIPEVSHGRPRQSSWRPLPTHTHTHTHFIFPNSRQRDSMQRPSWPARAALPLRGGGPVPAPISGPSLPGLRILKTSHKLLCCGLGGGRAPARWPRWPQKAAAGKHRGLYPHCADNLCKPVGDVVPRTVLASCA